MYLPIIYIIAHRYWWSLLPSSAPSGERMELVWYMFLIQMIVIYVWYTRSSCQRHTTNRWRYPSSEVPVVVVPPQRRNIPFWSPHQSMWRVRCLPPPLTCFSFFAYLVICNSLAYYMMWLYSVYKTKWDIEAHDTCIHECRRAYDT